MDPAKKSTDSSKRASPHLRSVSPLKRKLTKDDALNLIQEIYSKKFEDASRQIKMKNVVNEDFGIYVMRFA
jgi:hypothetical protein